MMRVGGERRQHSDRIGCMTIEHCDTRRRVRSREAMAFYLLAHLGELCFLVALDFLQRSLQCAILELSSQRSDQPLQNYIVA